MEQQKIESNALKNVQPSLWENLSQKKIYFGHQSVGFNIIEGIKDLMKVNPQIKLNIVETSEPEAPDNPLFAHSRVGSNMDPKSKTDAFASLMDKGIGDKADIAFFKFCYVDIAGQTDVQEVFTRYKETLARLRAKYPKTSFVHVTVPLGTSIATLKTRIKTLIRKKDIWEYDANIRKNEFNDLLRKEYSGKEPIFDLAYVESTFPDGRRSTFTKAGETYYSMVPEYTYDDGHLNETGRKRAAEQLLVLLANLN
ncbi:MAG: hypothetical protein LWX01_12110 [Deltaproteobacteria bacterium]|nr:hypothetical protein [Deltaproteobacteria bacterium]